MEKFGTDGIRSKAENFTPEFLAKIVRGLVNYAGERNFKVLIAGDTRESSEWIIREIEQACETFGVEYGSAGVLPTPGISYCLERMGYDFAIDITASHNPYTDNGIKIFEMVGETAQKLSEEGRAKIEESLAKEIEYAPIGTSDRMELAEEAREIYKEGLLEYVDGADLRGMKIGMDCANGATSVTGAEVFEKLGAKVSLINCCKKYNNKINDGCGSTHLENLQKLVREEGLDFGVAFDGDGDRCLAVNENGEIVDGDQMLAIFAKHLGLGAIATTVMANQGLINWAKENNVHAEITAVGDANVAAAMCEKKIDIGSEQSGHVILPEMNTGDGMLTALVLAKVVAETGRKLSELAGEMKKFPQVILNMEASAEQKAALKSSDAAKEVLLEFDKRLGNANGRLLVRPSGTENLIRITMWGADAEEIGALAEELRNRLGEIL